MDNKNSLREQILITTEEIVDCPPRHLSEKNLDSLAGSIVIEKVDLSGNSAYFPEDNLSESRVIGSLLSK